MVYTVKVRGYTTFNGKKYYGDWSAKGYMFTSPEIKAGTLKVSGNKLKLTWDRVKGATGYKIYVSTSGNSGTYKCVKTIKGGATVSATISKFNKKPFSAKKKYYAYVVTLKKVGSKTYNSGDQHYVSSTY